MSINITNSATTISGNNVNVSFEDIYQYALNNNKSSIINKLGTSYLIKNDLIIKNGATVHDTNKNITVEGDLLQISKGSRLHLGEKREDGSTLNGCTLNAPNLKFAYGFGNTKTTDSGDLLLYNSTINAYCFWGFFQGDNLVELIDCFVDGFGRISGNESIIKNVLFKRSHGKYGSISTKGDVKLLENIRSLDSTAYYDSGEKANVKCAIYHNPKFAPDLTVYYGEFGGYDDVAYIEGRSGDYNLELRGTIVKNGYNLYRENNANVDFYHSFKYKTKLLRLDGSPIANAKVIIKDVNNDVVFDGVFDQYGYIDTWIKYYQDLNSKRVGEILTPHTIEVTYNDQVMTKKLYVDKNFDDIPLYFEIGQTTGSGNCEGLEEMESRLMSAIANIESNVTTHIDNSIDNSIGDSITNIVNDIDVKIKAHKKATVEAIINNSGDNSEVILESIEEQGEGIKNQLDELKRLVKDSDKTTAFY